MEHEKEKLINDVKAFVEANGGSVPFYLSDSCGRDRTSGVMYADGAKIKTSSEVIYDYEEMTDIDGWLEEIFEAAKKPDHGLSDIAARSSRFVLMSAKNGSDGLTLDDQHFDTLLEAQKKMEEEIAEASTGVECEIHKSSNRACVIGNDATMWLITEVKF